jgi:soluble cytochrome b562
MESSSQPATPNLSSWQDKFRKLFYNLEIDRGQQKLAFGLLLGFLLFLALVVIFLIGHQQRTVSTMTKNQTDQRLLLLKHLRDIDQQLQILTSAPQNSGDFNKAFGLLNTYLSTMQKSINAAAKSSDIQKVSTEIADVKADIDTQMLDLKRTVANSQDAKDYLDPKLLPFTVVSIDVISQQPFVTINYAHHVTPLAIGDSVAGWQMTSADYDAWQVEFKNDHDQYIKVALQG